jgi:predicted alpha/beta-fold hydrolase
VRRERWDTPDGDFLDVDLLHGPERAPRLLLLHGLEGSSQSGYVRELMRLAGERGWGACALNFRGCSGEPNRRAHSYNSGDPSDARWVALRLRERHPKAKLFAAGFSLGGSVLLNLLAADGERAPLDAAAAVSVPYDLGGCADLLDSATGVGRVYVVRFLRTLRTKGMQKAKAHPGSIDLQRVLAARGIRAFDDAMTAPLSGYRDAADYYAQCSIGPRLGAIRVPALLLSAGDDPLAPSHHLPMTASRNPALQVELPAHGGHVGFVAGSVLRPVYWAEARAMAFFAAHAGR